jgi:C-terminal peptidase prc
MVFLARVRPLAVFTVAAWLVSGLGGCSSESAPVAQAPQPEPSSVATVASADTAAATPAADQAAPRELERIAAALEESPAPPNDPPEVPEIAQESDEEDEQGVNYWENVQFGPTQFEEVVEFVREYYIDPNTSEHDGYVEACTWMMGSLEVAYYAMPKAFYEARKADPDEKGELDGEVIPFKGNPQVVLVRSPRPKKEERGPRKTDDEIREARVKIEARRKHLNAEWEKVPFDRAVFDVCFSQAKELDQRDMKEASVRRQLAEKLDAEVDAPEASKEKKKDKKKGEGAANTEADKPAGKDAEVAKKPEAGAKKKDKKKYERPTPEEFEKQLWISSAQGFLRSLDPHSSVVSEKAWEESTKRTTDSSFEGIGAILTKRDEQIMVESPIEGQPAFQAGIRAGDIIVKVDEKSVEGLELQPVVQKIRGPSGTEVVLTIRREGEPEDLSIAIKRSFIKMQNVTQKMVKDHKDIGYIKLNGFVKTSAERIREAVAQLEAESPSKKLRGLVLDLRRNSGGLLQEAVEVADIFLREGTIVSVRDRTESDRGEKVYKATPNEFISTPLVVLVDDGSASASEIVAGAIQDNKRGLVIGDRTFGKASVQTLFNPRRGNGYYIKLTVARYYAPSGRTIQVLGISPDFEVPLEVGKAMPLGFREENLSDHLLAIEGPPPVRDEVLRSSLNACIEKRGIAERIHQADPNPQIRFDYPLMKAADYLECLIDQQAQASAKPE